MGALTARWLDGTLVSSGALHHLLVECALGADEEALAQTVRRGRRVWRQASLRLGPASGSTAVWMHLGAPLAEALAWTVHTPETCALGGLQAQVGLLRARSGRRALLAAIPWGTLHGGAARPLCRLALAREVPRVMLTNGRVWQCRDAHRPLGRHYAALDLDAALTDERVWEALWAVAHATRDHLETLARLTHRLEAGATRAVRHAVADVRAQLGRHLGAADPEVLTHVFRWLFLLFAEARGLVPMDNPVYRRGYAISTLAGEASKHPPAFGLWEGLQATARLAHAGCGHPLLPMTALNGALFDPGATPRAEHRRLPDSAVAPLLDALTTSRSGGRRVTIAFADLGVEHLGTIYEDVLATGESMTPAPGAPGCAAPPGSAMPPARPGPRRRPIVTARPTPGLERKRTGTFYTPRDLADHLVAETLGPLVEGRTAEGILALRILDPAAGSGAILASAARHLRTALDAAWVREGRAGALDVQEVERRDAVRRIVEECLYGVDAHGRAVQVARLSLWLASMTRERPLTFLDHHLRVGNSLVGATPADVVARSPRGRTTRAAAGQPRLFELADWDLEAAAIATAFARMSARPSTTADDVRRKTRAFDTLRASASLDRWRLRADAWCAAVMRSPALGAGLWTAVDARLSGRDVSPCPSSLRRVLDELASAAHAVGCFHWPLEFPDVFHGTDAPGFDAVLANPPWEMLRADQGTDEDRASLRRRRADELRFVTHCGAYAAGGTAHRNLYQLFVERMLQLCRPGGRLGVIAPWGLVGDHGSGGTRLRLFDEASVDRITVVNNRRRLFPIHRSVRFVVVTATVGRASEGVPLCPPVESLDATHGGGRGGTALWLERALIESAGGAACALPCLRGAGDVALLRRMMARGTRLGDAPWGVAFGRELNATDDRAWLVSSAEAPSDALPVIGGRDLRPFGVDQTALAARPRITRANAGRRLPQGAWQRWRLGYRDVASAGNRWPLIAAIVPPHVVTTHTVFTARGQLPLRLQLYLSGVLNSLVAHWFVRLYMGTHVTGALMARLPVPHPSTTGRARETARIARLAARLRHVALADLDVHPAFVSLQVAVARSYGFGATEMVGILDAAPRLPMATRTAILAALAGPSVSGR